MKLARAIILGIVPFILVACTIMPGVSTPTPSSPLATPTALASPATTPTIPIPLATPTLGRERSLSICTGSEPAELYLYSQLSYIKRVILSTIYDGPINAGDFAYQPVILEKLPSLADGDAVIETVHAQDGDLVMDDSGVLSVLGPGLLVRPAGCRSSDCAISYASGGLDMDRMRVTFHIRPGVRWDDGASVTAADSVFSYHVAVDEATLYGNNGLVSGSAQSVTFTASYTALDELTTEWSGLPGFLDPNYQINFFIPLPEHRLSSYTISQLSETNEVLYSPLGWGPYMVTSWEQGKQMTLEPNPNYYRAYEGLPYFDKLTFRFVGQDESQNLAAVGDGQCNLLLPDTLPDLPDDAMIGMVNNGAASLFANPAATLGTSPQPLLEQLTFNLAPADPDLPAIFANVETRHALAYCLDRSALAQAAYGGLVDPLDQLLPSSHPLMEGADLVAYPYDSRKGLALLASQGWSDSDGDGILEAHNSPGVPDGTLLR